MRRNLKFLDMTDFSPQAPPVVPVTNMKYAVASTWFDKFCLLMACSVLHYLVLKASLLRGHRLKLDWWEAENVSVEIVSIRSGSLSWGPLDCACAVSHLYRFGCPVDSMCWSSFTIHPLIPPKAFWLEAKCDHACNGVCSSWVSKIFTFFWTTSHPGILIFLLLARRSEST